MAVARDNFETLTEHSLDKVRREDLERCAISHDVAISERDDPRCERRREIQVVQHRADR